MNYSGRSLFSLQRASYTLFYVILCRRWSSRCFLISFISTLVGDRKSKWSGLFLEPQVGEPVSRTTEHLPATILRLPVSHGRTCKTLGNSHIRSLVIHLAKSLPGRCSSRRVNVFKLMDAADGDALSRRGSTKPPATRRRHRRPTLIFYKQLCFTLYACLIA